MSYEDTRLSAAAGGIEQLKSAVLGELENLQNTDKQLESLAVVVNNFVMQTLQVVSNNDDVSSVNEQLANSIVQIRDFVVNKPSELKKIREKLEHRLDAYEQCQLVLSEASKIELHEEDAEKEVIRKKKEKAIEANLDSSGKYKTRRKPGQRPEKLRDIRNVEAAVAAQKNNEEDI